MAARTHGRYHHWDLHFSCAGTVASLMVGFKHHPNLKSNFEACSRAPRSAIWLLPLGDELDERPVSSSAIFQDPYRAVRGRFDLAHPDLASLTLLVLGFGLATLAAARLGVDRTYYQPVDRGFESELRQRIERIRNRLNDR